MLLLTALLLSSVLPLLSIPPVYSPPSSPVSQNDWVVHWNVTLDDGIRIYNVTYRGTLVLRDGRIPGVIVRYFNSSCFFYDEFRSAWILSQNIFVEDLNHGTLEPSDQGFQIRGNYDVPGYDYQQIWRFLPDGRFLIIDQVGGGGCFARHVYETRWRLDFALVEDDRNAFSQYRAGSWMPVRQESNLTDSGQRDSSKSFTNWRVAFGRRAYYFTPFDTPQASWVPGVVLVVQNHQGEIENSHFPGTVTPSIYLNEEPVWRKDITIWYISKHFHDPFVEIVFPEPIQTGLIFYPSGI